MSITTQQGSGMAASVRACAVISEATITAISIIPRIDTLIATE